MKRNFIVSTGTVSAGLCFSLLLLCAFLRVQAAAQSAPAPVAASSAGGADGNIQYSAQGRPSQTEPVSYASVSELNGMLAQLEATSKNAQADLMKLHIERWKTDNGTKRESLGNVDSIQRNLSGALPEIIAQLRAAPEDVPATFKLYRNLDALYDVLGSVVESTGAFGSKDDLQALANDLNAFESTRKQMAARIENLSAAKEAEIARLRTELKTAQAAIPAAPPKKIVVDDTAPAKKPVVRKKTTVKPRTSSTGKPAAGQTQAPAPSPTPAKPQ
ncbi:MAG TPA: hypothetical protein VMD99_03250 [Terriglobales bacterium]|nr:hypothetical protein [Terriglobales bacterium]